MANNEQMTEQTESTTKQMIASKVDPAIKAAIQQIAEEEERSESNVIERALKQSPVIIERLEATA